MIPQFPQGILENSPFGRIRILQPWSLRETPGVIEVVISPPTRSPRIDQVTSARAEQGVFLSWRFSRLSKVIESVSSTGIQWSCDPVDPPSLASTFLCVMIPEYNARIGQAPNGSELVQSRELRNFKTFNPVVPWVGWCYTKGQNQFTWAPID